MRGTTMVPTLGAPDTGQDYPRGLAWLTVWSLALTSVSLVLALCATYSGRPDVMMGCMPAVATGMAGLLSAVRWAGRLRRAG